MIIITGFQPLTVITKRSILDVATVLDPPLVRAITRKLIDDMNHLYHFSGLLLLLFYAKSYLVVPFKQVQRQLFAHVLKNRCS